MAVWLSHLLFLLLILLRIIFLAEFPKKEKHASSISPTHNDTNFTSYISRNDDELEELKASRRPGRPTSSRQDTLQRILEHETQEFNAGFNIPDLSNSLTVKNLRNWSEDSGGLNTLTIIRISKDRQSM